MANLRISSLLLLLWGLQGCRWLCTRSALSKINDTIFFKKFDNEVGVAASWLERGSFHEQHYFVFFDPFVDQFLCILFCYFRAFAFLAKGEGKSLIESLGQGEYISSEDVVEHFNLIYIFIKISQKKGQRFQNGFVIIGCS